jgi:hypothetical protein
MKALRLTVGYVIVYMAARFGSTDADEFTLQQQNVKTKAATKYAVKVLSDFYSVVWVGIVPKSVGEGTIPRQRYRRTVPEVEVHTKFST